MRAAIFIDGAYFLNFYKKYDAVPKYEDLVDYFLKPLRKTAQLDLLRCYFYYCAPWMSVDPSDSEKRRMEEHDIFMEEIDKLERWSVRLGKLRRRWDGHKELFEQKRVDVLLSVDMVRHSAAGHIQHAIVVAGDSDFIPAVEATKESGATVTLWYGDENTVHKDLVSLADCVNQMNIKKIPRQKIKASKKMEKQREMLKQKQQEAPVVPVVAPVRKNTGNKRSYSKRRRSPNSSNSSNINNSNS
ncbi:MAG: NYN domain-containing protein [Spirochaetes bacterium]|nr:NYN domain-containing protein [Spirochaetota bacterium]